MLVGPRPRPGDESANTVIEHFVGIDMKRFFDLALQPMPFVVDDGGVGKVD